VTYVEQTIPTHTDITIQENQEQIA